MFSSLSRRAFMAGCASAAAAPAFAQAPQNEATAKNLADLLADYAAGLRYADLGPAVVELVKAHVIDALGCAVGAFNEPPVKAVRDAAPEGGVATVLGTDRRTAMDWAAFVNGAAIRHFDLNDAYAGREVGHPSDNIAPCLAVAEAEKQSGQALILAVALAYEIDCRLLDAVQISTRGWDHPNFSLPAAALAAGTLMRLPPDRLVQAVNLAFAGHLAFNQTRLQSISNWKGLADADAGRSAVFGAQLARAGITGPAPAFEGKAGFFQQVSGPFTVAIDSFGGRSGSFRIADCSVKQYPAQALLQTAIPAAAKIGETVRDPAMVKSILIETSRAGMQYSADSPAKWAPETSETADHSLPYTVVRSLLDREITSASYAPKALHDPQARALLKLVTVKEDPELTKLYPQRIPNRVTVTLNDGRVLTETVQDLPGFGGRPISRSDVEAKFRRSVRGVWPESQTAAFLATAWELDKQEDLSGLFRHMVVAR